jgi:hypothetical protein
MFIFCCNLWILKILVKISFPNFSLYIVLCETYDKWESESHVFPTKVISVRTVTSHFLKT